MGITKEEYNNLVQNALAHKDGVAWHTMETLEDGRDLCLVMGYEEGYDRGEKYQDEIEGTIWTLCQKLAVNIDDLQCDYGIDWYMPWDVKSGEVWDTDMSVKDDTDVDWYNDQAKSIVEGLESGTLEVK